MNLPHFFKKSLHRLRRLYHDVLTKFFRRFCSDISVVPEDFDWEFYLAFHSDLRQTGLQTKRDAVNHYARHGFFEKRIIRPQDKTLISKHEETRQRQLKNISTYREQQQRIITNDAYDRTITISVVITLYNYSTYIDACLRSVLKNTFKDIEIIIVNDCSTDDSLSRCKPFLSCDVPITIIDKVTNTGLSHSRNLGIKRGKGKYIFILDADNTIYTDCLQEHLNTMRSNSSLIACYAVIDVFDESGAFCGQNSNRPFQLEQLRNANYIDAMALFNRKELIAIGAYDEHLLKRGIGYEDYELWLRIGLQGNAVGFIESPLSSYLKKRESMLSVAARYYHIPIMSFLRHKYFIENRCEKKTAILVVGMHRSGTSALTGLIGRMGADLGPDLIGPDASNPKGHFEPRKIVQENDTLLERLNARAPGSDDLPDDWLEHQETKKASSRIQKIIREDFSNRDLFVIKDPRLCLLLPLYCELLEKSNITVKIIAIRRERQEVIRSLNKRGNMPTDIWHKYYKKHIKALETNLTGLEHISVCFDRLIDSPETVIEQITAFIPQLTIKQNNETVQDITSFIDPDLRHHSLKQKKRRSLVPDILTRWGKRLNLSAKGPDFLIIGAQRAGTTTLYHYLCQHPQILIPETKELHWFHAGPEKNDGKHTGHKSQLWYENQLNTNKTLLGLLKPPLKKLAFEATPEYLYHPIIAKNVSRLYPQTKIIVLLRDPLERAISQYYHEKKYGFIETDLSIEEYFAADKKIAPKEEPKLINNPDYYSHSYEHYCPIARSNYGKQLDRWLRAFPRRQILIIQSEEMFRNTEQVLNTIYTFLKIRPCPLHLTKTPVWKNKCERPALSKPLREKLAVYFPYDLSVEKFCTPPKPFL